VTRSNRTLNRALIALVGLVLIAAGALVAGPFLPIELPWLPGLSLAPPSDPVLTGIAVGSAVVALLALLWVFSRGRGEQAVAYRADGISIDRHVVEDLVRDALAGNPDVVHVAAHAYRLRGALAVKVRIDVRKGSDLTGLVDSVRRHVADLDTVLGTQLPLLVHITSGIRASFAAERRAA
jgi:hypothetical protein